MRRPYNRYERPLLAESSLSAWNESVGAAAFQDVYTRLRTTRSNQLHFRIVQASAGSQPVFHPTGLTTATAPLFSGVIWMAKLCFPRFGFRLFWSFACEKILDREACTPCYMKNLLTRLADAEKVTLLQFFDNLRFQRPQLGQRVM